MKTSLFFLMLVSTVGVVQDAKEDKERVPFLHVTKAAEFKKIRDVTADAVRAFDADKKSAGPPAAMAAGVFGQAAS